MLTIAWIVTIPALPCTQTRTGPIQRPDQHEGTSLNAMNVAFLRRGCEALSDNSSVRHGPLAADSCDAETMFFNVFWQVTHRIREIWTSLPRWQTQLHIVVRDGNPVQQFAVRDVDAVSFVIPATGG